MPDGRDFRCSSAPLARHGAWARPSLAAWRAWIVRALALLALAATLGSCAPQSQPAPVYIPGVYRGLNLMGPAQNEGTGEPWEFPTTSQLDYYRQKGLTTFRVPLLWEDLQPQLSGPLDPTYLAAMDAFVANCAARGERVAFTFINQAVYPAQHGAPIGSARVPASAFYDLWTKMALHYQYVPTVWAYDLINEPFPDAHWATHAQGAITAIRAVDAAKPIIVMPRDEGDQGFLPASGFEGYADPSDNLWYEDHVYFDADNSGEYLQTYEQAGAYPMIGVDRVRPFVYWCEAHHARCTVGEYGIPGGWKSGDAHTTYGSATNDPRWNAALDTLLSYLDANKISGTYWEAGPYGDINSVEPTAQGEDRPQMAVLEQHLGQLGR